MQNAPHPVSTLFPYTTLFRSGRQRVVARHAHHQVVAAVGRLARPALLPADADDVLARRRPVGERRAADAQGQERDRKSTRLNFSHMSISYAVLCVKKTIEQLS